MRPAHGSRDDWKAYAAELERRVRKYESWYCNLSQLLREAQDELGEIHTLLTASMWHDTDPTTPDLPMELVDAAEERLNELRNRLAVESDQAAHQRRKV